MDLAEMSRRRAENLARRREALIEDLDWMRITGEHTERVLVRLAEVGYHYVSLGSLAKTLRSMPWEAERTAQVALVVAWLVPQPQRAVVPEKRGPRAPRKSRAKTPAVV